MSEEANEAPKEAPKKDNGKQRKTRTTGRLALAFVKEDTLAGHNVSAYYVLPDQPEFASQKDAKDFIKDLMENDAYAAEFDQYPMQIVRLVGEPMKVAKEVKTTVSFN
jgi:hypothetical protein